MIAARTGPRIDQTRPGLSPAIRRGQAYSSFRQVPDVRTGTISFPEGSPHRFIYSSEVTGGRPSQMRRPPPILDPLHGPPPVLPCGGKGERGAGKLLPGQSCAPHPISCGERFLSSRTAAVPERPFPQASRMDSRHIQFKVPPSGGLASGVDKIGGWTASPIGSLGSLQRRPRKTRRPYENGDRPRRRIGSSEAFGLQRWRTIRQPDCRGNDRPRQLPFHEHDPADDQRHVIIQCVEAVVAHIASNFSRRLVPASSGLRAMRATEPAVFVETEHRGQPWTESALPRGEE